MKLYQKIVGMVELEGETYRTFGIRCGDRCIEDITRDEAAIDRLVELCNRLALSPIHLDDVVEDFLCE